MTTPEETTKAIKDFALKVRAALGDLTQEEIQDLTDGLEADLAERAAEQGIAFGSAAGYANELRAAAGIAGTSGSTVAPGFATGSATGSASNTAMVEFETVPIDGSVKRKRTTLTERLATWWQAKLDSNLLLSKTWAWLSNFRGFWWVLRGYAAFLVLTNWRGISGLLPASKIEFLFMLFCLLSSYVLSRKFWSRNWFLKLVAFGGHVFTVLAVLAVIMGAYTWQDLQYLSKYPGTYNAPDGLQNNGQPVSNIFAFDKDGKRISIVQLFDQSGTPIAVTQPSTSSNGLPVSFGSDAYGNSVNLTTGAFNGLAPVWNAWPLLQTSQWPDNFTGKLPTTPIDSPVTPVPKLTITAKHLLPTPVASPDASGNPSASPTPSMSGK
jgi:hypothetical protein